jgi:pimeloyl-ACP methyl ester carboxylesterase
MKAYFISGLAADGRVFRNIQLPPHYEPVFLDWIPPLKNEILSSYAFRLSEKINPGEKFVLIGLSFGGMIAAEIAKRLHPEQVILISSVPASSHLPGYYRAASFLRLHKIVPVSFLRNAALLKRLFTTETDEDKKMLRLMIRDSDGRFIRWALHAILGWKNNEIPENLVQVHGTRDEILPKRYTKPTHTIRGAGHMMVLNRAKEINVIIGQTLS